MTDYPDNRAVSALFRVFGGAGELPPADVREIPKARGMHSHEHGVFSILIPLTVWGACISLFVSSLGTGWSLLAGTIVAAVALQLMPLFLRGKGVRCLWYFWLVVLLAWAVWQRETAGINSVLAHVWIVIGVLEFFAIIVLIWRTGMELSGKGGIVFRSMLIAVLHLAIAVAAFRFGIAGLVVGAVLIGGLFCQAVLNPGSRILGYVRRDHAGGPTLITIDDGPDPHDTPLLLDLLDRHQAKAIFFMIGEKVRRHPELAREVVRRGHEIGNHTMTHPQASFWCVSPWRTRREIETCQQVIKEVTGYSPRWFRAPVGHRNLFTHPITRELGMKVMGWNRRGYDAVSTDADAVLAKILPKLGPGDIVLLHEATPIAREVLAGVLKKVAPINPD